MTEQNDQSSRTMTPLPGQLKAVGYGNLVVGPLLAIVNLIVVGHSISLLEERNAPEGLSTFFEINIVIYFVVGTLFVIGGVGLLRNRKWGRIGSLVAAISCFLALLAGSILSNIAKNLLESGVLPLRPGQTSFYFKEPMSIAAFAPLYGILVIVLLMLPDARAWARGKAATQSGQPPSGDSGFAGSSASPAPALVPARTTSGLAIASLVCSIIPFALLTQIAGLTLGIVALVRIKKSAGRLGGKGFAMAGITISSLILLFIGGILLIFVVRPAHGIRLAGSARTFSRNATVTLAPTTLAGDQTTVSGTVRNSSSGRLTGLVVVYTLNRREGYPEQKTVPVQPSDLDPQQEGHFSLQFSAKDYTAADFTMLNGDPGQTTLNYTSPRPQGIETPTPQK